MWQMAELNEVVACRKVLICIDVMEIRVCCKILIYN